MELKSSLILRRLYQKGGAFVAIVVRELSGGDPDGSIFQLEVWQDSREQETLRERSDDRNHIRRGLIQRLLDLQDDGWSMTDPGLCANSNLDFFNPAKL